MDKHITLINCKTIGFPIEQIHRVGSDEGSSTVNRGQYQRLVGKLFSMLASTTNEMLPKKQHFFKSFILSST